MFNDFCQMASNDFEDIREILSEMTLEDLIYHTDLILFDLDPYERINYDVNMFCNGYDDRNGRIALLEKLFNDGVISALYLPCGYELDPDLKELLKPIDYSFFYTSPEDEMVKKEPAPLTDDLEVITGQLEIGNPGWEHTNDELKTESADKAVTGDIIELSANIKNYPEKAPVTFDIYDVSSNTPLRITSVETRNENGIAKTKWTVEDPEQKGENLKLAFEAIARSKASPRVEVPIIPKIDCDFVEVPDILFHHNSAVPCLDESGTLISSLSSVFKYAKENTDKKIVIFGHSDTSGDPEYNHDLSQWRAEGIKALLDNKKDAWLDIVELASKVEDYQTILKSLYDSYGWSTDPGAVDNANGPKTKDAVNAFQGEYNNRFDGSLKQDGVMGQNTWGALFEVIRSYLVENIKKETGEEPVSLNYSSKHNGLYPCGESFPIDEKGRDDYKSRENRRVEIVFFDKGKAPELIKPESKKRVKKSEAVIYDKRITEKKPVFSKPVQTENNETIVLEWVYPQVFDESKPHKQYVNLDSNGKEQGNELTIKVKTKDLKANTAGKNVYWRVTADNKNSKRNSPKTGIMDKAGGKLVEFTAGIANLDTSFEKNEASIVLACGLAGGDRFTVEAGTDGENFTSKFVVENWRRLWYEIWQPKSSGTDKLTDYTVFKSNKKPGLSENVKDYMKRNLEKCYVAYDEKYTDCYEKTDIPANSMYNLFDASYFNKNKNDKITFLTLDQAYNILVSKAKHRNDSKVVTIIFADFIGEYEEWNKNITGISSEIQIDFPGYYIFEKTIDKFNKLKLSHGEFSVKKMSWRAKKWFDSKAPGGGQWKQIKIPDDPGYNCINPTVFKNEDDIKAHLEFVDCHTMKIKLPYIDTKKNYPAVKLTKNEKGILTSNGIPIQISINISGGYVVADFNGAALQGNIWMTTFGGNIKENGLGGVLLHELGHNMGQVYSDKSVDKTFGRPAIKAIPGIPFPEAVPVGVVYGEHGHTGTHCASGLSSITKKMSDYQKEKAFKEHNCIMFGSSDMQSNKLYEYCDKCITYIRAEDLCDIRKDWS